MFLGNPQTDIIYDNTFDLFYTIIIFFEGVLQIEPANQCSVLNYTLRKLIPNN